MSPLGRKPLGTPTCYLQIGKGKSPGTRVLTTWYQGSFALIGTCAGAESHRSGARGRDDHHDGGARGIRPAPKKGNGRPRQRKSWHGAARRTYDAFSDGPLVRSTRDPTASLSWRGRWWKCRGDSVEKQRHSPRILLSPLRAAGAPPPSGHLSWLRPFRRRPGLLPGWRPAFAARW